MKTLLFSSFIFAFSCFGFGQSSITIGQTTLQVDTLVGGLDIPWELLWGPDDYLWMTERRGRVSRVNPNNGDIDVILNHQSQVWQNSESGMLGMALHPDFATMPYVYIAYTYGTSASNAKEKLVRFEYDGTELINETTILDNIPANSTHNGARIIFLPDGTLLMTTGDAQNTQSSQNMNSLAGKVLRINPDGTVPSDNPYGPDSYVYASGLRNAQGMVLMNDGRVFLSEHGPATDDEFMELLPGRNYGWPNVEGFCTTPSEIQFCQDNDVVEPLVVWTPTIAPSDLIFYENPMFPEWHNKFLMTVLKDRMLVALDMNADFTEVLDETWYLNNLYGRLRDICVGPNKEIYLATNGPFWSNNQPNTHTIVRLTPPFSDVSIPEFESDNWRIYPNPAKGKIQIDGLPQGGVSQYTVRDAAGRIIFQLNQENITLIDIAFLDSGMYFLEIQGQNLKSVKSFIVAD